MKTDNLMHRTMDIEGNCEPMHQVGGDVAMTARKWCGILLGV
jgi:hypothetical protein